MLNAEKIDELSQAVHDNTKIMGFISRFWWVIIGALAAGYIAAQFSQSFNTRTLNDNQVLQPSSIESDQSRLVQPTDSFDIHRDIP